MKKTFRFNNSIVDYYFDERFSLLKNLADNKNAIIITDENVFAAHEKKFGNWDKIVIKAGEENKTQQTVDAIIGQLIEMGADRNTILIGVGGGVITDITGYVASVYMRGIAVGFVPTSLLALVDASIGGKNGVDVGVYKNMVGTIRQPKFILHDVALLSSLPENEWRNGFAEIIKHAAIKDAAMFRALERHDLNFFRKRKKEMAALIQRNALLKTKIVQLDEFEKGDRKLLNFGHTLGHALENQYQLSHGEAISIGMSFASKLSQNFLGFKDRGRVIGLLEKYGLPTSFDFDKTKVFDVLVKDKKREKDLVYFILLEKIGKALIKPIAIKELQDLI